MTSDRLMPPTTTRAIEHGHASGPQAIADALMHYAASQPSTRATWQDTERLPGLPREWLAPDYEAARATMAYIRAATGTRIPQRDFRRATALVVDLGACLGVWLLLVVLFVWLYR